MRRIAAVFAVGFLLGVTSISAQDGKVDGKKTEKGAGELFRGMGQEIQRSGILGSSKDGKKDEKKEAKKAAPKKDAKKEAKEEAK